MTSESAIDGPIQRKVHVKGAVRAGKGVNLMNIWIILLKS